MKSNYKKSFDFQNNYVSTKRLIQVFIKRILFLILFLGINQHDSFAQWTTDYLSVPRSQLCACVHGTKIYFAGGKLTGSLNITDVVDILDVSTGIWTVAYLEVPKREVRCEVVGDKIFFVGNGQSSSNSKIMDVYDASTDEWTFETSPNVRAGKMAANGNKIYLAAFDDLDVYDIENDVWERFEINPRRIDMGMVSLNDQIILAGGNYFGTEYNDVSIFDVNTKTWKIDSLPMERGSLTGQVYGDKAYFATEESDDIENFPYVHIYDDITNTMEIDSMIRGNRFRISQTVHDGRIYYAGGQVFGLSNQHVESLDIFDTTTQQWTATEIPTGRSNLVVVGYQDKIYFAGGIEDVGSSGDSQYSTLVEVFDLNACSDDNYVIQDTLIEYSLIKAKNIIAADLAVSFENSAIARWFAGSSINIELDFCVPLGAQLELSINDCEE